eukprot:363941-Chlamydomonas_euryale.AAC.25
MGCGVRVVFGWCVAPQGPFLAVGGSAGQDGVWSACGFGGKGGVWRLRSRNQPSEVCGAGWCGVSVWRWERGGVGCGWKHTLGPVTNHHRPSPTLTTGASEWVRVGGDGSLGLSLAIGRLCGTACLCKMRKLMSSYMISYKMRKLMSSYTRFWREGCKKKRIEGGRTLEGG